MRINECEIKAVIGSLSDEEKKTIESAEKRIDGMFRSSGDLVMFAVIRKAMEYEGFYWY